MFGTVDEVGRVAGQEGIDCHYVKGGALQVAASPVQLARLEAGLAHARRWGMGPDDQRLLGRAEAERRVGVAGLLDAAFTPHCATVDPARLARGLAGVVERLGVPIYEATPVTRIRPGRADTTRGPVTAEVVVRATEGYSATLPGLRRSVLPLYSLMLATEPLPDSVWEKIGWSGGEAMAAGGHQFTYAQRTRDGRIALGGRGAPYHFGSRVEPGYDRDQPGPHPPRGLPGPAPAPGRRRQDHPPLGRAAGRPPRLDGLGRPGPVHRPGLGRRLRRRRGRGRQPGRPHPGRPGPRAGLPT